MEVYFNVFNLISMTENMVNTSIKLRTKVSILILLISCAITLHFLYFISLLII